VTVVYGYLVFCHVASRIRSASKSPYSSLLRLLAAPSCYIVLSSSSSWQPSRQCCQDDDALYIRCQKKTFGNEVAILFIASFACYTFLLYCSVVIVIRCLRGSLHGNAAITMTHCTSDVIFRYSMYRWTRSGWSHRWSSSRQSGRCCRPAEWQHEWTAPSTDRLGGEQLETLLLSCSEESISAVQVDLNNLVAEWQQVMRLDSSDPLLLMIELQYVLDSHVNMKVEYWPIPLLEPKTCTNTCTWPILRWTVGGFCSFGSHRQGGIRPASLRRCLGGSGGPLAVLVIAACRADGQMDKLHFHSWPFSALPISPFFHSRNLMTIHKHAS